MRINDRQRCRRDGNAWFTALKIMTQVQDNPAKRQPSPSQFEEALQGAIITVQQNAKCTESRAANPTLEGAAMLKSL
jgi:hypothetical protein